MEKMEDNKGTPSKGNGSKDDINLDPATNHDVPEIERPNPSIATPSIPDEMPAREIR